MGNEYYIPLNKGEEYQIWVKNGSNAEKFVRVLVDGMNTLSQRMADTSKGMTVEETNGADIPFELAPIVELETARSWVADAGQTMAVAGYYNVNESTPAQSSLYRFELGDADESLGARKSYTQKLGRITIGIYDAVERRTRKGTVGTKIQAREDVVVGTYTGKNIPADEPAVVYNIRYVSQEEFDKL